MKFLIDANLPISIKLVFANNGFDVIHTLDLPNQNLSEDNELCEISEIEDRVIVTKDSDFYHSFIIKRIPKKLVLVRLGNCKRKELIDFFEKNIIKIIDGLEKEDLIILS